jgi:Zn-dependent metalloprotease
MVSALAGAVILGTGRPAAAQLTPGEVSVAVGGSTGVDEMRQWDATVDGMTRAGELVVVSRQADRSLPGRTHEYLAQFHEGVQVHAAGLSRQLDGGVTVSLFGTLYTGIEVETAPALNVGEAVSSLVQRTGARPVDRLGPQPVILPLVGGSYELTYPVTLDDLHTYFVSAADGVVVQREAAFQTQSAVGTGAGFLGDTKKISTTQESGRYEARDRLRPGEVVTLDAGFDAERLVGLIEPGPFRVQRWTSSDIGADTDNVWDDSAVVDGHVHMGWTYDYLAQRHGWQGLDGQNGRIVGIVNNSLFNALAITPPFGPEGAGVYVFGQRGIPGSEATQPRVALHTVAHELVHGLEYFSVARRTGGGLARGWITGRFGPTSFEWEGETYACPETRFLYEIELDEFVEAPAVCSEDGEFLLGSSHEGALGEAFSDIFAVSTGFFHEAAGAAGNYEYSSEYAGGTLRSLSDPWSARLQTGAYPLRFEFALGVHPEDDRFAFYSGALFVNEELLAWVPEWCCYGALHWNSTILSHAFYLAIEGGTNLATRLTVEGAGVANREQVERIFFRALTELMPRRAQFWVAADVIRQAAADLAAGTDVQRAIEDALVAVGLPPLPPEPAG